MLHFSRLALIMGAPLILTALLAWVTPAGAGVSINGQNLNGQNLNGLSMNGSALGDLNGVVVEAVILPDATR